MNVRAADLTLPEFLGYLEELEGWVKARLDAADGKTRHDKWFDENVVDGTVKQLR